MADLQPLRTLRYDTSVAGPLEDLIAPPYDVIDDAMRAELAARSPFNVVEIDLPPSYAQAAATMADWRERGVLRPGGRAGRLGVAPGLHHPHRRERHAHRLLRPRARGRVRTGADSPPRAHPSRAQGGPPQADARHAHEPVADLRALSRLRPVRRASDGADLGWRALCRGGRRAAVAIRGSRPDRRAPDGAGRRRAADRRRPSSLRDGADLCRRDRRRGRPPLRADAALLAVRPRPADLPNPPPAHRAEGRSPQAGRDPRGADTRFRDRGARRREGARAAAAGATAGSPSATWTPSTRSPTG